MVWVKMCSEMEIAHLRMNVYVELYVFLFRTYNETSQILQLP